MSNATAILRKKAVERRMGQVWLLTHSQTEGEQPPPSPHKFSIPILALFCQPEITSFPLWETGMLFVVAIRSTWTYTLRVGDDAQRANGKKSDSKPEERISKRHSLPPGVRRRYIANYRDGSRRALECVFSRRVNEAWGWAIAHGD
jgi:hypothetical protein